VRHCLRRLGFENGFVVINYDHRALSYRYTGGSATGLSATDA
jgi:hypothetical protein